MTANGAVAKTTADSTYSLGLFPCACCVSVNRYIDSNGKTLMAGSRKEA